MPRQSDLKRLTLLLLAGATLPLAAGETAVLSNGFRLRADRHEIAGAEVRLISGERTIVLPAAVVDRFEADEPPARPDPPPPAAAPAAPPPSIPELVSAAAGRHGLPPELVRSVARAESGYRPDAVSPKGAIGVMQLMPATAAALAANPWNPAENIEAGTRLLRDLLLKYDGNANRALAAYNAGPAAVEKFNGIPPYRETQLYVDRVVRDFLRQTARKSTTDGNFQ